MVRHIIRRYEDAVRKQNDMNLQEALARIEELEDEISDLELENDDLEEQVKRLEDPLYDEDCECGLGDIDPEDLEDLNAFAFLREIGLDPWNLPNDLGTRMVIRDLIAAARVLR